MTVTQHEFDKCANEMILHYYLHANTLKQLSAEYLDEMQLKATIRNDYDLMILTELANS